MRFTATRLQQECRVHAGGGRRETLGNRHPNTLTSIHSLGVLLHVDKGDLAAAEPLCLEAAPWEWLIGLSQPVRLCLSDRRGQGVCGVAAASGLSGMWGYGT